MYLCSKLVRKGLWRCLALVIVVVFRLEHLYLIAYTCQMAHGPGVKDGRPRALAPDAGGRSPALNKGVRCSDGHPACYAKVQLRDTMLVSRGLVAP